MNCSDKHLIVGFCFSLWEYWLGKTKKIVANSTWALLLMLIRRLFKKEGKKMAISKVLASGPAGSVSASIDSGVAKMKVELGASLGGGKASGVLAAKVSAEMDVELQGLIDLGLEAAAEEFPAAKLMIDGAKAIIDAELSKV